MKKNKKTTDTSIDHNQVTVVGDQDSDTSTENFDVDQVQKYGYFITPVYHINKSEFLPQVRALSTQLMMEHEREFPQLNDIYPMRQSRSMLGTDSIKEFVDFVGGTAWNALQSEGYDMNQFSVVFQEMWVQEHHKHSGHDEHVHPYGSQLIGFYFLDTPENSGRLCLHDPRPAKRQINLPEANPNLATDASTAINFEPRAGDLYFAPSWVPHSISRHGGDSPLRLVHITLSIMPSQKTSPPTTLLDQGQVTVI